MASENIPYRLSWPDGIQPTEVAWVQVSFVPNDKYDEFLGTTMPEMPEGYPAPSGISLQMTGLMERDAALIVEVSKDKLVPHQSTIDNLSAYLLESDLTEQEVVHIINVFSLGILVGVRAVELTEEYAKQGIKDIESGESPQ